MKVRWVGRLARQMITWWESCHLVRWWTWGYIAARNITAEYMTAGYTGYTTARYMTAGDITAGYLTAGYITAAYIMASWKGKRPDVDMCTTKTSFDYRVRKLSARSTTCISSALSQSSITIKRKGNKHICPYTCTYLCIYIYHIYVIFSIHRESIYVHIFHI